MQQKPHTQQARSLYEKKSFYANVHTKSHSRNAKTYSPLPDPTLFHFFGDWIRTYLSTTVDHAPVYIGLREYR